jgi:hypothetical protein
MHYPSRGPRHSKILVLSLETTRFGLEVKRNVRMSLQVTVDNVTGAMVSLELQELIGSRGLSSL